MKNNTQKANNFRRNITIAACLLVQLSVGILYLWSIFNESVREHLGFSKSTTNLVGSAMIFAFVLGNLIGGFLQDKTNPRLISMIGCLVFCLGIFMSSFLTARTGKLIFLTYSAMGGIGCGFVYGSILSCMLKWFPTRRGFASGLSVAAFGLSTVVFAPLSQILLKNYGVTTTFRVLGIAFFAVSILSCVFISLPKQNAKAGFGEDLSSSGDGTPNPQPSNLLPGLSPKEAVKLPAFWCIALTLFFANATWNILIPIIKPLGIERGLSSDTAGIVVMVAGIFNVAGRFGMASLSDKIRREFAVIAMSALTLCCAVLLIFATKYFYFAIVALAAFGYGGPSAILPAMTVDICGARRNGTNYGIAMLGLGFSSIAFSTLSNLLYESSGKYTLSFVMAAATCIISAGLMLLYARFTRSNRDDKSIASDVSCETNISGSVKKTTQG